MSRLHTPADVKTIGPHKFTKNTDLNFLFSLSSFFFLSSHLSFFICISLHMPVSLSFHLYLSSHVCLSVCLSLSFFIFNSLHMFSLSLSCYFSSLLSLHFYLYLFSFLSLSLLFALSILHSISISLLFSLIILSCFSFSLCCNDHSCSELSVLTRHQRAATVGSRPSSPRLQPRNHAQPGRRTPCQ